MTKIRQFNFSRSKNVSMVKRLVEDILDDELIWQSTGIAANRYIEIENKECLNFGTCSYLGLHFHEGVKQAAKGAIDQYGTQFSISRAFSSCGLYQELESIFETITERHVLITPTTTLAHISTLPILISDEDIVIIDQFAHASLHLAADTLGKTPVYRLKHNDMVKLDEMLQELSTKNTKVWCVIDGLYSMRGDFAPFEKLNELLEKYSFLHLYVDDAHSMSWYGKYGKGAALTHLVNSERVIVALSLSKAFGTGGGVVTFATEEQKKLVRLCGGPLTFSAPVQPPTLGASVASAKIHITSEFADLQSSLYDKIMFTKSLLSKYDVEYIAQNDTPIFFLPCDSVRQMKKCTRYFWDASLYVCPVAFPAVPQNMPGIRFTISAFNDTEDIELLISKAKEIMNDNA